MALVVLLRGINVGGHRSLRPKTLANDLEAFDVVNIGAAGTFVVRKPGSRTQFLTALRSRLPDTTQFVCCDGRDVLELETRFPLDSPSKNRDIVQFVSFLAADTPVRPSLPLTIPRGRGWCVRVTGQTDRLLVGEYRRQMKAIGYLGELDALYGTLVTTRSRSTVSAIAAALRGQRGSAVAVCRWQRT